MRKTALMRALNSIKPGTPVRVAYKDKGGAAHAVGLYSSYNEANMFLQIGRLDDDAVQARVAAGYIALSKISGIKILDPEMYRYQLV